MNEEDDRRSHRRMEEFYENAADFAKVAGVALLILGMMTTCIYMKKWEYDECLMVGHSPSYCTAQAMGCFGGGKK